MSTIIDDDVSQAVLDSYTRGLNECQRLYDEDELQPCIDMAAAQLEDTSLPRYHRIKFLLLLGACLDDWYETEQVLGDADMLWHNARNHYPRGSDEKAEEALWELRQAIDSLLQQHRSELPSRHPNEDMDIDAEEFGERDEDEDEEASDEDEDGEAEEDITEEEMLGVEGRVEYGIVQKIIDDTIKNEVGEDARAEVKVKVEPTPDLDNKALPFHPKPSPDPDTLLPRMTSGLKRKPSQKMSALIAKYETQDDEVKK